MDSTHGAKSVSTKERQAPQSKVEIACTKF